MYRNLRIASAPAETAPETRRYFTQVDVLRLSIQRAQDGRATVHIPLLPEGKFSHPWYGALDWSAERLQRMVDHHDRGILGVTPMLNFDHEGGPAAGWLPPGCLSYEPGQGLVGAVDLTELGTDAIEKRLYRYISAEWWDTYRDSQGNKYPDVLAGAALTNTPFHTTMPGLFSFAQTEGCSFWVAKQAGETAGKDRTMGLLEKARRFFGLPETASEEEIEQRMEAAQPAKPEAPEEARVAAMERELVELRAERTREREAAAQRQAEAAVDAQIAAGRIVPAKREAAVKLALSDAEGFASLYEGAPAIVDLQPHGFHAPGEVGEVTLTPDEEREVTDLAKTLRKPVEDVRKQFQAVKAERSQAGR